MMYIDHIEDDPSGNPEMRVAYVGYGTPNQIAYRMERAMILEIGPEGIGLNAFAAEEWKP